MISNLIVPLDGSPLAERSVPIADAISIAAKLPVLLYTASLQLEATASEAYLADQAHRMHSEGVTTEVGLDRFAPAAMVELLEGRGGSLLVMSSHGRTGLGLALLGSVTEEVLRLSQTPVLLVGPHWNETPPKDGSSVLMCVDGVSDVAALTAATVDLAKLLHLHVWVVQVIASHGEPIADVQESAAVHRVAEAIGAAGVAVDWEVLHDKHAAHALMAFADAKDCSVVALATHGRDGIKRVALGSVAMHIVRRSPHAALVVACN
jgi:nucleotide-binding universal stress UspA family protein